MEYLMEAMGAEESTEFCPIFRLDIMYMQFFSKYVVK